ncbi:hypothetical protein [Thermococcus sp. JdF3]|uniref:hypothetical protein n=1 Tax=Thermococcus sp. JdF3 TaxID=1638258 RepID=UPI0014396BD7|nr:hypothetical protein [Thermococcus sp. JdF3]NJE02024.1 hypothetical protein [Thermococcus sp. JdF3]
MGKKGSKPMTPEAASRIQSAVDSGRAIKADAGFKARAMRAAARNSKNNRDYEEEFEDTIIELILDDGAEPDEIFDIGNWF